jgi:PAS domain S-box-containing protein
MEQKVMLNRDPFAAKVVTLVRREDALLKAGALQNAILNSANFSSIATDEEGVIQIFNVGAERMLGYTAGDVLNKITPADISDPQELIARAKTLSAELGTTIAPGFEALVFKASRGIEDIYELTYIRKDGTRFPAIVSVTALRDGQGGIIGYLLIGTDNSARKRAEEALLKAGALQSAIFNSANFSSIATDEKGVIQIFNVGAERMLGYAAADVMNKITPADISDSQEVIARAKALSLELAATISPGFEALVFKASRGIEDIYELTYIRKDGSRFPAIVSVTALRDGQGGIIGYLLIGTDNTARKQAEEALLKAGALQTAIFKSANFSCIATDAKGVIQLFNVGAERMMGYTAAEVLNKITPADLHDPQEMIVRAQSLSQELGTTIAPGFEALAFKASRGIEDVYELTKIRKDGTRFPAMVSVTALRDGQSRIIGYLLIGTDNTARKQVEEERKRFALALQDTNVKLESAKSVAEKANLAKSEFLSSMSHELRSPLNAILGFAQLLESASPPPTAPQAKSLARILQAGWYLLKLINEVLDLAVIESGKLSMSKESVSLGELMAECHAMMEPQAQQAGISMTFPQFDLPVFVSADRTRLKQIVINLVSNAIKYNKVQGTVVVACAASVPERVRLSVTDTGAGLPPEKLAQLFQPFNRLGQEVGSVAGTGIGLVVCKRLAELMQGAIGVESALGVGSVFWCELNAASAPQLEMKNGLSAVQMQPPTPADAPKRTVLYVEDNPANMELVQDLIARFPDMGLVTAVNGTLGITIARTTQPQVILMDINLPGLSGIKALQILQEDPETAHIPVIALSANAMPRDIERGLEAGFFRYLTKPIQIKEFMGTLNDALEFAEKGQIKAPLTGQMT